MVPITCMTIFILAVEQLSLIILFVSENEYEAISEIERLKLIMELNNNVNKV